MSAEYPPKEELKQRRAGPDERLFSGQARQIETGPMAHRPADSQTAPNGRRTMSAFVLRLAKRLGKSPEEVAAGMDPDTIRRTKYAVIEDEQPDGTVLYKHSPVK